MIENNRNQNKIIAAIGAVILHALVLGLLFFIILPAVKVEEQGAVLVNIGDIDLSSGTFTPSPIEPVTPPPSAPAQPSEPSPQEAEELLTQEDAEAPVVTPPKKKVKEQPKPKPKPKQEVKKPQKVDKPVDTEAKKREEEARRAEEQRRQQELQEQRRREAISKSVSGAFGAAQSKGSGAGDTGDRREGSPDGNVTQGGSNQGVGGFGSFNLSGRSLAGSGLVRPSYTAQEEGTIVVKIAVNPKGEVITATIAPGTNISNTEMRNSAIRAAKATRFNAIEGINNQTGTITYRYRLR